MVNRPARVTDPEAYGLLYLTFEVPSAAETEQGLQ